VFAAKHWLPTQSLLSVLADEVEYA
jgi:hypothetical protein